MPGYSTNLGQLHGILGHAAVRDGDARTTLLAEAGELSAGRVNNDWLKLLDQQARTIGGMPRVATQPAAAPVAALNVVAGDIALESPMAGTVVEISANPWR